MDVPPIDPRLVDWIAEVFRVDPPTLEELKAPGFLLEQAFKAGQASVATTLRNHLANQRADTERRKSTEQRP